MNVNPTVVASDNDFYEIFPQINSSGSGSFSINMDFLGCNPYPGNEPANLTTLDFDCSSANGENAVFDGPDIYLL